MVIFGFETNPCLMTCSILEVATGARDGRLRIFDTRLREAVTTVGASQRMMLMPALLCVKVDRFLQIMWPSPNPLPSNVEYVQKCIFTVHVVWLITFYVFLSVSGLSQNRNCAACARTQIRGTYRVRGGTVCPMATGAWFAFRNDGEFRLLLLQLRTDEVGTVIITSTYISCWSAQMIEVHSAPK